MGQKVVSAAHSINLWPVENVLQFAVVGTKASYKTKGSPRTLDMVPGSLKVSDVPDSTGIYTKKLSFKVRKPDRILATQLRNLSGDVYVADYVDENGNTRIAGSPSYPLSYSFKFADGLYEVTLQGKGEILDAYTL